MERLIRNLRGDQQNLNWDYIIVNTNNLKYALEYTIISIYKQIVLNNWTKIRWDGEKFNQNNYRIELQKELDFYVRYLA